MWAICLRYTKDHDQAKDVLQDGFMKIFDKIAQFEGRGNFEGWMRKVIVNTAIAEYRKQRYLSIETMHISTYESEVFDNIESNISADELMNIVQELPPQYKLVFNMYAIEGYAHKEIAELLGITEGTSKSNLSRARDILQRKINNMYPSRVKIG
jgi:RNA polymerase sigma factor (sigma-70 family)